MPRIAKPAIKKKQPGASRASSFADQGKRQHVDFYKKRLLRLGLVTKAAPGPVYVPFCGDGDLAKECYKGRECHLLDIDSARVKVAARIPDSKAITHDAEEFPKEWAEFRYSICDFDSYCNPYQSFTSYWASCKDKPETIVMFFTDGARQAVKRTGHYTAPDGSKGHAKTITEKRELFNKWLTKIVAPWFEQAIAPYKVIERVAYTRKDMLYWGVVISTSKAEPQALITKKIAHKFDADRKEMYLQALREGGRRHKAARSIGVTPQTVCNYMSSDEAFRASVIEAESEADDDIESALRDAAKSGNVTAALAWLYSRQPNRWSDTRKPDNMAQQSAEAIAKAMLAYADTL